VIVVSPHKKQEIKHFLNFTKSYLFKTNSKHQYLLENLHLPILHEWRIRQERPSLELKFIIKKNGARQEKNKTKQEQWTGPSLSRASDTIT
jgi:hypothetical protein